MPDSHGSQDRHAIPVYDRGFVSAELAHPAGAFDLLRKLQGAARPHDRLLRLPAGRLSILGIFRRNTPGITVVPPCHIFPGFPNHRTECLVDFYMGTVQRLKPHHIGKAVYGRIQIGVGHIKIVVLFQALKHTLHTYPDTLPA